MDDGSWDQGIDCSIFSNITVDQGIGCSIFSNNTILIVLYLVTLP